MIEDRALSLWLKSRQRTLRKGDLSRMRSLCARLGDPQQGLRCVHVAGTNGKGTFCALLAAALRESGYRTGLYISPHLADLRERIQLDGRPIPAAALARLLRSVREAEREPVNFFEILTAAAFLHFRGQGTEVAVIETGLGGRLDATNVLESPELCVVSSIGFDHVRELGDTLARIAEEKAGIFKKGVPVLCGKLAKEPLSSLRARARALGCAFHPPRARLRAKSTDWKRGAQVLEDGAGKRWALALAGAKAADNAALVLDAARILGGRGLRLPQEALRRAFSGLCWPGRFQRLDLGTFLPKHRGRVLILDGAHNPPAMAAFLDTWRASPYCEGRATFMVGMLADKDHASMLAGLSRVAQEAIAVRPDSSRALEPSALAAQLGARGCRILGCEGCARAALSRWLAEGGRVGVVCGSFYLVGGVLKELRRGNL